MTGQICLVCGRDDGHWLGCDRAVSRVSRETKNDLGDVSRETSDAVAEFGVCEADDCTNPKLSKHPRAKYCGDHKVNR